MYVVDNCIGKYLGCFTQTISKITSNVSGTLGACHPPWVDIFLGAGHLIKTKKFSTSIESLLKMLETFQ